MAIIKIGPGAQLTDSTVTGNIQIGGDALIDNQGDIRGTKIDCNLHVPIDSRRTDGPTDVKKEIDSYLLELPEDERFSRLKAIGRWLKDHVLAAVIIFILTTICGIYINRWLSPSQENNRPPISEPKAMPV